MSGVSGRKLQARNTVRVCGAVTTSLASLWFIASASTLRADDQKPKDANGQSVGGQSDKIRLDGGYLINLSKGSGKDLGFYLIEFEGNKVLGSGTAFKTTNPSAAPNVAGSDGSPKNFKFRLERSTGAVSGGILSNLFSRPLFKLKGLDEVRGRFGVDTTTDFKSVVFSGGLESPVINPLAFLNSGKHPLNVANWFFVSAFAESQNEANAGGKDQDVGVGSYRGFIGTGWNPVATGTVPVEYNAALEERVRSLSEKDGEFDFGFFKKNLNDIPQTKRDWIENVLHFISETVPDLDKYPTARWERLAFKQLKIALKPVKNFNTIQLWADTAGWYQFTGTVPRNRFTDLTSVNLRFYMGKGADAPDKWIGLRYENGTERATPGVYKNFGCITAGFTFK